MADLRQAGRRPALLGLLAILLCLAACTGGDEAPSPPTPATREDAGISRFPLVIVEREGCLRCHAKVEGLAEAHAASRIGCSSCHLGDPWSADEREAHEGMVKVPGNLDRASETCGQLDCHPQIVARVATTLMADGRGLVGVDRWVFGEIPTPDSDEGLTALGDSPADSHLRDLCLPCHLAYPKLEPAPITELSRGGGCTACHLNYHADGTLHPALDLSITDAHCFGCHSRSGRISTNYEGWHETLLDPAEVLPSVASGDRDQPLYDDRPRQVSIGGREHRLLEDGRLFVRRPPDLHHTAGLSCIDCHTARETMGDGRRHLHQEEQIEIACTDCHRTTEVRTRSWDELDAESRSILRLRHGRDLTQQRFVVAERSGQALINLLAVTDGTLLLQGKLSGVEHPLRPPVAGCELDLPGHRRLACQACHSGWVPQCLGCHTQKTTDGEWAEFRGSFLAEPPTLGVSDAGQPTDGQLSGGQLSGGQLSDGRPTDSQPSDGPLSEGRIRPFTPAMIFTLNAEPADLRTADHQELQEAGSFHRLFAPATPHTTQRRGRTCRSCHNDPLAIGYGRGELRFDDAGSRRWTFQPTYGPHRDGLPADAWIAFPASSTPNPLRAPPPEHTRPTTTRSHARPFSPTEQRSILRVGACLTCHQPDRRNMERIYRRFQDSLTQMDESCRLPL